MYCKNCGGNLTVKEDYFLCENCHSKFEFQSLYGNDDVFLAYVENDDDGRRTKDSMIAQEIYHRLEQAKVTAFFQKISADSLLDDVIEPICTVAAENAKIIIIIGTSVEHFEELLEKYNDVLKTKSIIPIYYGISPYDLPQQLKKLQGLNYDAVGAKEEVLRSILHILNRDEGIELFSANKTASSKKKKRVIIITVICVVLAAFAAYMITGTPYFLKSKKYEYANNLVEDKNYTRALQIFYDIRDYNDSETRIQNIYNLYAGTYADKDGNLSVQIGINDAYSANMKMIRKLADGSNSFFNESAQINKDIINCSFQDSNGKLGECNILLKDNGIQVTVFGVSDDNKEKENDVFIPIENKTDEDLVPKVSKEEIFSWLDGNTTINQIQGMGYDIEVGERNKYSLKNNSGIKISIDDSTETVESVTWTAGNLCPQYLNKEAIPYYDGDTLYVPSDDVYWVKKYDDDEKTLSEDYVVTVATKQSYSKDWEKTKGNFEEEIQKDDSDMTFVYTKIGDLKEKMTAQEVKRILGEPEQTAKEFARGMDGASVQDWNYTSKGITITFIRDATEGQVIEDIRVTAPCDFATPKGIKIGSSYEEVKKAYKGNIQDEFTTNDKIVVGSIYGGTMFDFDGGIVSRMAVGVFAE